MKTIILTLVAGWAVVTTGATAWRDDLWLGRGSFWTARVAVTVESDRGKKVRRLCTRDAVGAEKNRYFRRGFRLGGRRFRIDLCAEAGTRFCFTGGMELLTE